MALCGKGTAKMGRPERVSGSVTGSGCVAVLGTV